MDRCELKIGLLDYCSEQISVSLKICFFSLTKIFFWKWTFKGKWQIFLYELLLYCLQCVKQPKETETSIIVLSSCIYFSRRCFKFLCSSYSLFWFYILSAQYNFLGHENPGATCHHIKGRCESNTIHKWLKGLKESMIINHVMNFTGSRKQNSALACTNPSH